MKWMDFGYDLRLPLCQQSRWKVGDLHLRDFTGLLGSSGDKIDRIVSFDLNLSPRPGSAESNRPGAVDLTYGAFESPAKAIHPNGGLNDGGLLLFWQIERSSYERASAEGWFRFVPEQRVQLPDSWRCIGTDVINDQGLSEYWDISESFWHMDTGLIAAANTYGLVEDESLITRILPLLPLDPANRWVMPVRAWIAT